MCIRDSLYVTKNSAETIQDSLNELGIGSADVVVSGIPFSTMSSTQGMQIVRNVSSSLSPGGRFVAYQLRNTVANLSDKVFGSPSQIFTVWKNIPPMRVYCWKKSLSDQSFVKASGMCGK